MREIELKVEGIMCEGCVNRINNVLASIKGIDNYYVSLDDKCVLLTIKDDKVLQDVIDAIDDLGFRVCN